MILQNHWVGGLRVRGGEPEKVPAESAQLYVRAHIQVSPPQGAISDLFQAQTFRSL